MAEHFPPADDDVTESAPAREANDTDNLDSLRPIFAGVSAAIVLGVGAMAIFWLMYSTSAPTTADSFEENRNSRFEDSVQLRKPTLAHERQPNDADSDNFRRAEQAGIRNVKLQRLINLRDKVSQSLDQLASQMESWRTSSEEYLNGDVGRRIANDPNYVEQFVAVLDAPSASQSDFESFQQQFLTLSKSMEGARRERSYEPSDEFYGMVDKLSEEVELATQVFQTKLEDIDAIRRFASNRPLSDHSLSQAIADYREQQHKERIASIAEAKRKAELEMNAAMAKSAAEKDRLQREVELMRARDEASRLEAAKEQMARDAAAAAEQRKRDAERAVLEREYQRDLAEIQSLLRPFITKGRTQPKRNAWRSSADYSPVSYSALQASGMLDETVGARQGLYFYTTGNRYNDREHGSFPRYVGGASDWTRKHPTIERAQDLLQKYGELMVEKGLLAP